MFNRKRMMSNQTRSGTLVFLLVAASIFCLAEVEVPTAHASLLGRVKDIYNAPDKVEELESEYRKAKEELDQQTETFNRERADMQDQARTYQQQADSLARQNETLAKQNEALLSNMDAMQQQQQRRAQLTRRIGYTVGTVLALGILYLLCIRFWRYTVWRQQRRSSWRG